METPGPLAFARENFHPIIYQAPEDDRMSWIIQGGRGRDTRETQVPDKGAPTGADRDLGTGQGQKIGDKWAHDMASEAGTCCGELRLVAEVGEWRWWANSRWTTYHASR